MMDFTRTVLLLAMTATCLYAIPSSNQSLQSLILQSLSNPDPVTSSKDRPGGKTLVREDLPEDLPATVRQLLADDDTALELRQQLKLHQTRGHSNRGGSRPGQLGSGKSRGAVQSAMEKAKQFLPSRRHGQPLNPEMADFFHRFQRLLVEALLAFDVNRDLARKRSWPRNSVQTRLAPFGTKLVPNRNALGNGGSTLFRYGR